MTQDIQNLSKYPNTQASALQVNPTTASLQNCPDSGSSSSSTASSVQGNTSASSSTSTDAQMTVAANGDLVVKHNSGMLSQGV